MIWAWSGNLLHRLFAGTVGDPIYGRDLSEATVTPGGAKITNAKPGNPPSSFTQYDKTTYGISDGRDPDFGPDPDFYQDFTGGASNDYVARFNIQSRYRNWPIPQSQVDAMAPTFPQNPEYQSN